MDRFDFSRGTAIVTGAACGRSARVPDVLARLAPARYPALLRIAAGGQARIRT